MHALLRCHILFTFIALCTSAQAGVYRWTDEQGTTHFSTEPPPDQKVTSQALDLNTLTPINQASDIATPDTIGQLKKREVKDRQDLARRQAERERRKKNCVVARGRLNNYETASRIRTLDDEGNIRYLTEKEHSERIADMRLKVTEYCSD